MQVYKKKDLYTDVRDCIREGLSIKETASLCGCSIDRVKDWTKDIRDVKPRSPRMTTEQKQKLVMMFMDGVPYKDIAKEIGASYESVRNYIKRNGVDNMRGGYISNQIDIDMMNAEASIRKANSEPEKVVSIENISHADENAIKTVSEPVNDKMVAEVEEPLKTAFKAFSGFANLSVSMDGQNMRYMVRGGNSVRCQNRDGEQINIRFDDIEQFASELLEIGKRFGGLVL